jgi:hypothetical protein
MLKMQCIIVVVLLLFFFGMFIFFISLRIALMNGFLVWKVGVGDFHTTGQTTQVFQSLSGCFLFLLRFISEVDHEFIFLMADFKYRRYVNNKQLKDIRVAVAGLLTDKILSVIQNC